MVLPLSRARHCLQGLYDKITNPDNIIPPSVIDCDAGGDGDHDWGPGLPWGPGQE